jgi:hypothetical protein
LEELARRLIKYIEFRLEPIKEFRKKFEDFQDRVLKILDWIVKKLEKYDQEYTIMSEKYTVVDEKLENHESRIMALEKKTIYKT